MKSFALGQRVQVSDPISDIYGHTGTVIGIHGMLGTAFVRLDGRQSASVADRSSVALLFPESCTLLAGPDAPAKAATTPDDADAGVVGRFVAGEVTGDTILVTVRVPLGEFTKRLNTPIGHTLRLSAMEARP